MNSPASRLAALLATQGPGALDAALASLTVVELAALAHDWPFWAREKQLPPPAFRSFGLLAGRGFGKTRAIAEHINSEVAAGRAMLIGLAAQNEEKTIAIQVEGPSGLIATAPPWFKPRWEATAKQLVWPNGARAYALTPEVPGTIRGVDYHLAWLSEIQSWPTATRDEAFSNFMLTTRLGYSRTVWDATPKRRHPILRMLLNRGTSEPDRHVVVRGAMRENADNLGEGVVDDAEVEIGLHTVRGREELLGIFIDDDEDAMFKQAWIDRAVRDMPERLSRRVISIDPAITSDARFSDDTGIVEMGLGVDGQIYVIRNMTGKHRAEVWPGMVVEAYVDGPCDLIWLETNRGGDAHVALLRVAARDRGLSVVVLGKEEKPLGRPGVVYVRAINTKGSKGDRAGAAASLTEKGRVSFVRGAKLGDLVERLCAFDGHGKAPDDAVDAFAHGCVELAGLTADKADYSIGFRGADKAIAGLQAPVAQRSGLAGAIPRVAWRGKL